MTTFFYQKKFGTAPLIYVHLQMFGGNWRENDVKTLKWCDNWHTDIMHESRLTPLM